MVQTTLCYLERAGAYLMLHRPSREEDPNRDKWLGIGGKFEEKESPEDCLLRECREETGLTLTDYRFRGIVTFVSDRFPTEYMHLYTAAAWTGALRECREGTLEWVPKEGIAQLPIWEGDRIFFDLLEQNAPFFSLKLCYQGERLTAAVLNGRQILGRDV